MQALLRKVEFIQILVFNKMEIGMDVFLSLSLNSSFFLTSHYFPSINNIIIWHCTSQESCAPLPSSFFSTVNLAMMNSNGIKESMADLKGFPT